MFLGHAAVVPVHERVERPHKFIPGEDGRRNHYPALACKPVAEDGGRGGLSGLDPEVFNYTGYSSLIPIRCFQRVFQRRLRGVGGAALGRHCPPSGVALRTLCCVRVRAGGPGVGGGRLMEDTRRPSPWRPSPRRCDVRRLCRPCHRWCRWPCLWPRRRFRDSCRSEERHSEIAVDRKSVIPR